MERIETDVCIAGAGYTGLTAALHLTQVGHRVDQGDKLVATDDGTLHRYHGVIPSAGILALASLGLAMEELDSMAKEVPLSDPWEAPHTQEWANQTLGTWRGSRFNVPLDMARQMPAVMDGGGLPSYPSLNTSRACTCAARRRV
jgi:2-polyprenyl-6-methoxyphenol hydroxylase-like FAD-dependent oxidoreductase